MKRTLGAAAAVCLAVGLVLAINVAPAQAAAHYGSCTSLQRAYPDGVASSAAAAAGAVKKGFGKPAVNKPVYTANKKLGHGGAGFICATRAAAPTPSPTPTPTQPAAKTVTVTVLSTDAKRGGSVSLEQASSACAKNPTSVPNLWQNGTQIVAKDQTGAIISTGQLDAGGASNPHQYVSGGYTYWDCTWTASLVVPPATFYTFVVGGTDTSDALSSADLIKYNYQVSLKFAATY